mmetsp:Transcript_35603/g.80840  ORF Transcript_35603/g.80840 Transcript_35603/m.80840 type:complete len:229 (-) Transcript_35603:416-1102(-)
MSLYSSVCQSTIRTVYVGGPGGHDTNCTDFLCRRGVRMPPAFFVENVVAGTHGIKTTHWHRPHGTDPEANGMEQARKQADGGLGSMYAPTKAKYVLVADLRAALKLLPVERSAAISVDPLEGGSQLILACATEVLVHLSAALEDRFAPLRSRDLAILVGIDAVEECLQLRFALLSRDSACETLRDQEGFCRRLKIIPADSALAALVQNVEGCLHLATRRAAKELEELL